MGLALLIIYLGNPQNIKREICQFIQSVIHMFDLNPLDFYFCRGCRDRKVNPRKPKTVPEPKIVPRICYQEDCGHFEHLLKKLLICFNVTISSFISFLVNLTIFKNGGIFSVWKLTLKKHLAVDNCVDKVGPLLF